MTPLGVLTLALPLLVLYVQRIRAQTASCESGWDWMNNTAGQNPCQIIEILDSQCLGLQLVVAALPNGSVYSQPDDANSPTAGCDCNSPVYSLFSACAACQGAGWLKWSEWSAVCGVAHVAAFPNDYFISTPVPHWAFIDVTVNDTFVPDTAQLIGGLPEQRVDGPTTTFSPTVSSTLIPTRFPISTSTMSSNSSGLPLTTQTDTSKAKTPVGAIAGGTIGGLVVLCLTGFIIIVLFFRKTGGLKIPKIRRASGPMSLFDSEEPRSDPRAEEAAAVKRPLLYDPTNPATFSQVNAELERPLQSGGGT